MRDEQVGQVQDFVHIPLPNWQSASAPLPRERRRTQRVLADQTRAVALGVGGARSAAARTEDPTKICCLLHRLWTVERVRSAGPAVQCALSRLARSSCFIKLSTRYIPVNELNSAVILV